MSPLIVAILIGASGQTWEEPVPAIAIVQHLKETFDSLDASLPPQAVALLNRADLVASAVARPLHHYYVFRLELVAPVRRLHTLKSQTEVWAVGGKTVFKTTVDIQWGRNGCIARFILDRIEAAIVEFKYVLISSFCNLEASP